MNQYQTEMKPELAKYSLFETGIYIDSHRLHLQVSELNSTGHRQHTKILWKNNV